MHSEFLFVRRRHTADTYIGPLVVIRPEPFVSNSSVIAFKIRVVPRLATLNVTDGNALLSGHSISMPRSTHYELIFCGVAPAEELQLLPDAGWQGFAFGSTWSVKWSNWMRQK